MSNLYIGLMSGTSMDAVDGVLAELPANAPPRAIAHAAMALPEALRNELLALNTPGDNELHRAAMAANALVDLYADVVIKLLDAAGMPAAQVRAIGAHGQTVRHQPDCGYTLQLNAPARLAEATGIGVVADLRSRDVAAGGQGAPLVPAFHQSVFGAAETRVILNLGGIANISVLRPGLPPLGFDTGPANLLLDLWCQRHTGRAYDQDGTFAARGQIDAHLLRHLVDSEPWLALPPPKSTGRDRFNAAWLDERLQDHQRQRGQALAAQDVQATLTAFTAKTVVDAILAQAADLQALYICGGGAHNPQLMQRLTQYLPGIPVRATDALGVPAQHVEALAFAWLAQRHIEGLPGNVCEVTGARGPRILGAWYPA